VAYYSQNEMKEHISSVVISDCLKHDIVAVHLFQSKLCSFRSCKLKDLTNIYYFSDDAAMQNKKKRKNFINLCYHEDDLGMVAECHCFATSYGKGACNGIGGRIKRQVCKTLMRSTS
jgi:hypothetical protein